MARKRKQIENGGTTPYGVVLAAFGKPQYYHAAYLLAYSIKRFNKDLHISLLCESEAKALTFCGELKAVINAFIEIPQKYLIVNGKIDPALFKLSIYSLLPYDSNLYLDVDAICLKDLQPLIDSLVNGSNDYATYINGEYNPNDGRDFKAMQWAWADHYAEHFGLDLSSKLYAVNSSIQFIRKSDAAKAIFETALKQYLKNQFPLHKLRYKWGGGQPDELYLNASIALNDYKLNGINAICFQSSRELTYSQIDEQFYLMSYYGGRGFTPLFYTEWLDRKLKQWFAADGSRQIYFINRIIENKYAEGKR